MKIQAKAPSRGSILSEVKTLTLTADSDDDLALLAAAHQRLCANAFWTPGVIADARTILTEKATP